MRPGDQAGNPQSCPGSEYRDRRTRYGLTISYRKQIFRRQVRQRQCDRLKIIKEVDPCKAELAVQLIWIDRPWAIRQDATSVLDRPCHRQHGGKFTG